MDEDNEAEVAAVGEGVPTLHVGDRVVGCAAGQERARNTPAERGCQRYAVLLERVGSPIPDGLTFAEAVLVWGASTSVGTNAVQLARASGFAVLATAGRSNHELARGLAGTVAIGTLRAGVSAAKIVVTVG